MKRATGLKRTKEGKPCYPQYTLRTGIREPRFRRIINVTQSFSISFQIGNTLTDAEFLIIDLFFVTPLSVTCKSGYRQLNYTQLATWYLFVCDFLHLIDAMSLAWKHLEASTPSLRLLTPSNLCSVLSQLFLAVATQICVFIAVQHQPW